jgi:hypothetical protein
VLELEARLERERPAPFGLFASPPRGGGILRFSIDASLLPELVFNGDSLHLGFLAIYVSFDGIMSYYDPIVALPAHLDVRLSLDDDQSIAHFAATFLPEENNRGLRSECAWVLPDDQYLPLGGGRIDNLQNSPTRLRSWVACGQKKQAAPAN